VLRIPLRPGVDIAVRLHPFWKGPIVSRTAIVNALTATVAVVVVGYASVLATGVAADTLGSGDNEFEIQFVGVNDLTMVEILSEGGALHDVAPVHVPEPVSALSFSSGVLVWLLILRRPNHLMGVVW
jgi:hypothetical protein